MTWLLTHSGIHFDLIDPQPDMIKLIDIAVGLACEARFAGQTRTFYSVAQHCVIASQHVAAEYALETLLHDASEAYIKDIPRPLKALLPDYRQVEERIEAAIRACFRLPAKQNDAVTEIDRIMLATERRDLMPKDDAEWPVLNGIRPLDKRINPLNPYRAEALFNRRVVELVQP